MKHTKYRSWKETRKKQSRHKARRIWCLWCGKNNIDKVPRNKEDADHE